MLSTMQDEPLSLATLLRYAATVQSAATVSTWTGTSLRTISFGELGEQAARLANALRGLGVGIGDRVATFMWNNNEHQIAYIAVPAMGAVLHALNIRLPGPQLSYTANHAADQDRFRDGWLRTGDIATITPDGYLTLVDRAKDVIKSGGEWISSVDLENLVMEHPAVAEAAVIGVPDERWDERPLVFVVRRDGAAAAPEELRQFLAGKVARWQLPERWAFVDGLPKTSVGKFDKKALRASYADGAVDVDQLH